ncbi:flavanone 3-hydroxylase [Artemisia annua]|nr:flavanone 3-hydroxylase [Artemisia annua]
MSGAAANSDDIGGGAVETVINISSSSDLKLIKKDKDSRWFDVELVPESYIFSPTDRPQNLDVAICDSIPVIDLAKHIQPIESILKASQEFGFFQVINHGVPEKIMSDAMSVLKEFFHMPSKEATGEVIAAYLLEINKLSFRILEMICEGLGLEPGYLSDTSEVQILSSNFYPSCPDPSLTLGILAHQDTSLITLVYQGDSTGLQFLKDGQWINVGSIPNSFVVNIGNQLEIVSNGKLRSIDHRVVTSKDKTRISIATFVNPSYDCIIEPAKALVNKNEPSRYKASRYKEYVDRNKAFGDYTVALRDVLNSHVIRLEVREPIGGTHVKTRRIGKVELNGGFWISAVVVCFIILFEVYKKAIDPKADQPENDGVKTRKNGKNKTKKIGVEVDDEKPIDK